MRYTQNRELSWLNFNKRVLEIGADPQTPLFERLKFVAIFQSNLSEFFMIRVGGLHDVSQLKKDVRDNKSGMTAKEQLDAIYKECVPLEKMRDEIYADLAEKLRKHGIYRRVWEDLEPEQLEYVKNYAERFIEPMLSAQIIDQSHPFPHLQNGKLYVAMELHHKLDANGESLDGTGSTSSTGNAGSKNSKDKKSNKGAKSKKSADHSEGLELSNNPLVGIIPMPPMVPRIINLPGDDLQFILLEDALLNLAPQIFDMYTTGEPAIISVTRNADINPDDEDYADNDYRQHMKKILKKRTRLAPVRLQVQGHMRNMRELICKHLDLDDEQVFHLDSPIDLSYVYKLESKLTEAQEKDLLYKPFSPIWPSDISRKKSMFEQIRDHDIMLSYPYDSIDPFIELLREAACDKAVASIKITLYRLASISKIAECLVAAAENGKDVVVLMELRARFDEEANIKWAEHFEEAGCTVIYGMEGFKCHSKICQITRIGEGGVELYTQLSTGNYNEKTAKQYTDISLMTFDSQIGLDGVEFFNNMAMGNLEGNYHKLWVAPSSFKSSVLEAIDEQIEIAKEGGAGQITIKCNSVTDLDVIQKLSEASCAGVHINMIVRGICCLLPGIEGATQNIEVISIVGRLLEHSRIYCFGTGENAKVYLASADLMTRNTERRVEIGFPVESPDVRARVLKMISVLLSDTACAQKLMPDGSYVKLNGFCIKHSSQGKKKRDRKGRVKNDANVVGSADAGAGAGATSKKGAADDVAVDGMPAGGINAQTTFMKEAVKSLEQADKKHAKAKAKAKADIEQSEQTNSTIPVENASVKTAFPNHNQKSLRIMQPAKLAKTKAPKKKAKHSKVPIILDVIGIAAGIAGLVLKRKSIENKISQKKVTNLLKPGNVHKD